MTSKIDVDFEQYLKNYYNRPYGQSRLADPRAKTDPLYKGATMTGLTYVSATSWFDPVYSAEVALQGLTRSTSIFKLLPKTTYQQKGDSYQYIATENTSNMSATGESGLIFTTETTVPTITDIDSIVPSVVHHEWEDTTMATELSKIQRSRAVMNPDLQKTYETERFWNSIDMMLAGVFRVPAGTGVGHGVDAPATNGTYGEVESIDRMITCQAEVVSGTYVSLTTDGNIFWNNAGGPAGAGRYDRNGGTLWDAQVTLPVGSVAAGVAYNILDELDDLMAKAKCYAKQPYNYIALMSPKAMNKIQNEIDPKQRYLEGPADVTQTIGGVSTRPGVEGGKVSVSSLTICGVKVPCFESPYLMGTASSNWLWLNTVHTTGGVGNIFLINMDAIEFRTLVPPTYETWPARYDIADAPAFGNKHVLYMMGQLIAWNWQSHAALKYIAS
jgi:hypothetical protein